MEFSPATIYLLSPQMVAPIPIQPAESIMHREKGIASKSTSISPTLEEEEDAADANKNRKNKSFWSVAALKSKQSKKNPRKKRSSKKEETTAADLSDILRG